MFDFLKSIILSLFRRIFARSPVEADIVALHHQVAVLRRQVGNRPKLTRWDRLLFAAVVPENSIWALSGPACR